MLAVLVAIETAALFVGAPLLLLYARERVRNLAREATDRALADYRLQQEQVLAAVNAAHQRRLTEFGLYARKRHQVYAALYRRCREASDRFASLIGLTMGPDFTRFTLDDVREYLQHNHLKEADAADALAAYERGDRNQAGRLMDDIHRTVKLRDAEGAFVQAKNVEALHELYLSDPVRTQMDVVREKIAAVSVTLMPGHEERDRRLLEKREEMQAAVRQLFVVLRDELRRGGLDGEVATKAE